MLSEGKSVARLELEVAMLRSALLRARPFVIRAADDASPVSADARIALKVVDDALTAAQM